MMRAAWGALFTVMLVCPSIRGEPARDPLSQSDPSDWRALDPAHTLYMELPAGRVVIELAPAFAPGHVANILALVRQKYFDGLAIIRVHDNYVTQWGDPEEKPVTSVKLVADDEYHRPIGSLPFTPLPDGDVYAPEAGFSDGWRVARDPQAGRIWLTHCYGALGVARGNPPDNGLGTELYVVIGHAPRHLDRNITLAGRVVQGMELLSGLPRGTGTLGFYEKPEQRTTIKSIRVAADLPQEERIDLEVLRTDTATFRAYLESRRQRKGEWWVESAGKADLCNVPVPVRERP